MEPELLLGPDAGAALAGFASDMSSTISKVIESTKRTSRQSVPNLSSIALEELAGVDCGACRAGDMPW